MDRIFASSVPTHTDNKFSFLVLKAGAFRYLQFPKIYFPTETIVLSLVASSTVLTSEGCADKSIEFYRNAKSLFVSYR